MLVFLLSALRAIVEMLGLCLIGQGILYVIAGEKRLSNPIYRLFRLLTEAPRRLAALLPGVKPDTTSAALLAFFLLFLCWLGLAWLRNQV
jgi:uncharacterized membrane protein HdeD (DUF308 family)